MFFQVKKRLTSKSLNLNYVKHNLLNPDNIYAYLSYYILNLMLREEQRMQSEGFGSFDFDIMLTYVERFASLLTLVGYVLLFLSAGQAEQTLIEQKAGVQPAPGSDLSPKTAVDSSVIRLVGFTILSVITTIRLVEREQRIKAGTETEPIYPNKNITLGSWISTIGFAILTIGVIQRERQLAPVTIL
jgi:hypothetical protein